VRVLFNGGEPIAAHVMQAFSKALAPAGLRREAMFPVYGLAEATLAATFPSVGEPPLVTTCDRLSLHAGASIRARDEGDSRAVPVVSVGRPVANCRVRVVDDEDRPVGDNVVGHVQVQGPNVTSGYYRDASSTAGAFAGEWLRTGDLGFLRDGQLFVTGRVKDVLFVNGQNLYAHDIEQTAMDGTGARRVAVCGCRPANDDT